MADQSPRSWFQFNLRTFFWVVLVIAVGLVAYRRGYDSGFADRANQRSELGDAYVVAYSVCDVVPVKRVVGGSPQPDCNGLIEDLTAHVLPNTWIESGGNAAVVPFEANKSLVIRHDRDGHERIAAYLERLRRKQPYRLLTSK